MTSGMLVPELRLLVEQLEWLTFGVTLNNTGAVCPRTTCKSCEGEVEYIRRTTVLDAPPTYRITRVSHNGGCTFVESVKWANALAADAAAWRAIA